MQFYEDYQQLEHSAIFQEEPATQDPTYQELVQYAQVLGIDPQHDKDYMYIVREALREPLPENWRIYKDRYGQEFYLNINTKEKQKDFPTDQKYRKKFLQAKERDLRKQQLAKSIPQSLRLDHQPINQQLLKKKKEISKQYANKEDKLRKQLELDWKQTQKNIQMQGRAPPTFESSGQDLDKLKSQLKANLQHQYQSKLLNKIKQLKDSNKDNGQLHVVSELNQDQLKSLRSKFQFSKTRLQGEIAGLQQKEKELHRNKTAKEQNIKKQILDSSALLKAQLSKIQSQARAKVQSKKNELQKKYQSYHLSIFGNPQAVLNDILQKKRSLTQLFDSKFQFQKKTRLKQCQQESRSQFQRLLELKKGLLASQFSCKLKEGNEKFQKQLQSKLQQLQKSKMVRLKLLQQQMKADLESRKNKLSKQAADKCSKYTYDLLAKRQNQNLQDLEIQKKQLIDARQQLIQETNVLKERIKFLESNTNRFRLIKQILQLPAEEQQSYLKYSLQKLQNRPMSQKMMEQKSKSIIDRQTVKLNKFKNRLLQDKLFIKKMHQYIRMDQERVKISVRDINNSFLQQLSKQAKIDALKKGLQSIVVQFNQDVSRSRKNQQEIKAYEKSIQQLAFDNQNFQSKLAEIIKVRPDYHALKLRNQLQSKSVFNEQVHIPHPNCISTSQSVRILRSHRCWISKTKLQLNNSLLALKGVNMPVF